MKFYNIILKGFLLLATRSLSVLGFVVIFCWFLCAGLRIWLLTPIFFVSLWCWPFPFRSALIDNSNLPALFPFSWVLSFGWWAIYLPGDFQSSAWLSCEIDQLLTMIFRVFQTYSYSLLLLLTSCSWVTLVRGSLPVGCVCWSQVLSKYRWLLLFQRRGCFL